MTESTSTDKTKVRRGVLKAALTKFTTYVNNFRDNTRSTELQFRFENMLETAKEFDIIQTELEQIDENQSIERTNFENAYFKIMADAKALLNEINSPARAASTINQNQITPVLVDTELPKISLPEFDGAFDQWHKFSKTFKAVVDSNSRLDDTRKFYLLQSALKGKAANILDTLDSSEDNYSTAWDRLRERYENNTKIIFNHIKAIFDLEPVVKNSFDSLRDFLDAFNKHLGALENLKEPTNHWDSLLIYLIFTKLHYNLQLDWNAEVNKLNKKMPELKQLMKFLNGKCDLLESFNRNQISVKRPVLKRRENSFIHVTTDNINCPLCKNKHLLFSCEKFRSLNVNERWQEVRKFKLCINCLKANHTAQNCRSSTCKKCEKRHNTMLHPRVKTVRPNIQEQEIKQGPNSANNDMPVPVASTSSTIAAHITQQNDSLILLMTAIIDIINERGELVQARALIDPGSQSNMITKNLAKRLNLKLTNIEHIANGVGSFPISISQRTSATISSRYQSFKATLSFLVINKITENIPQFSFDKPSLNIPTHISLADEAFNNSRGIDILLGQGIFLQLLIQEQISLGRGKPVLQNSKLGWFIGGPISLPAINTMCCVLNTDIDKKLERFWKIEEEIHINKQLTREELECENEFSRTHKQNSEGRFIVTLPLKGDPHLLGDTIKSATRRFFSLEKQLMKKPMLKLDYDGFLKEYESLGHMTLVEDSHRLINNSFYLPHHAVFKESSSTTKLRVVFDASAKCDNGLSLNSILKVGPTIQDDLFSILIRFRNHKFVLTGDIAKMYRQILVTDEQRDWQRIVWRENNHGPLKHYRLNTLTYGTAPASFLATRCLHELARQHLDAFPEASNVILKDFYVDDLLTGADDIEKLVRLKRDVVNILKSGCFELRKWGSNNPLLLNTDCNGANQANDIFIADGSDARALGIIWVPKTDSLKYSINFKEHPKLSKRAILSSIAQIFDPLGLISPATVQAKLLMQDLWSRKVGWDTEIPSELLIKWQQFVMQIDDLNKIQIPRWTKVLECYDIEIHGFSDASERAYGACVYVKSFTESGTYKTNLICAKSRVAPLKTITLPRLELCGALLLSELVNKVIIAMNMVNKRVIYWTDSTIVLCWIHREPGSLKTFVGNRINRIRELTAPEQWRHVRSADNPADLVSRGLNAIQLRSSELWWQGPTWLSKPDIEWPKLKLEKISNLPDCKPRNVTISLSTLDQSIFLKYSNVMFLIRVIGYCLRFIDNCKRTKATRLLHKKLSLSEIEVSKRTLIKLAQADAFPNEIKSLKSALEINKNSKLLSLNPFLDINGIIRVGGRLNKAFMINHNQRNPIILSSSHPFTKAIIQYEHKRLLHAGTQAVLCATRDNYWIMNGRNTIRGVIRKCITCFKARPYAADTLMGDLPAERVAPNRPFKTCGIDYAGPILIKDGKLRNKRLVKAYMCIFVCFATKAIHIELASDLTSECFLDALKRFCSRRGLCTRIFSDNGSNFVGANNLFINMANVWSTPQFDKYIAENKIEWSFIPPGSPHFGGLWEAGVRSIKHHLRRVTAYAQLTYEKLYTVLTQIEAILNSRPLCPLTNDPTDLNPLTPGHFLIGEKLIALPQHDLGSIPINRLNNYQQMQQIVQHFWSRWSKEYLNELQARPKWKTSSRPVKIGDMVVIKHNNLPPQQWQLGRIVELHPGSDGVSRVVSVKTNSGVIKCVINKICVLPIGD